MMLWVLTGKAAAAFFALRRISKGFERSDVARDKRMSQHIVTQFQMLPDRCLFALRTGTRAAIEAGNSEKVIRESYLNTSTFSAAKQFWKLEPQAT
jgi:hypothetical protein